MQHNYRELYGIIQAIIQLAEDGIKTSSPVWYTEKEMHNYLRQNNYSIDIADELAKDWAISFQEAYEKGKQHASQQPAGAVWIKASERLPKPVIDKEVIFINRTHKASLIWKFTSDLGPALNIHVDGWALHQWEWLDEIGTPANELPTFWDVAKAFKWAAEYRDEIGGQLTLYSDQWTLISDDEDGNENETKDLTPGNVAELYCLQNGFNKEAPASNNDQITAALRKFVSMHETGLLPNRFTYEEGKKALEGVGENNEAIELAEWLRVNNMSPDDFGGWGGGKINTNIHGSKTDQLYQLWQQSKSK